MLIPWEQLCEDGEGNQDLLDRLIDVGGADPLIFDAVMRGILHPNPCIRILAATMAENITQVRPLFLTPYKRSLLNDIAMIEQVEVRQQIALMYGRVFWDEWELKQVVVLLGEWIEKRQAENTVKNSLASLQILATQKEWISPVYSQHLQKVQEETEPSFSKDTLSS